jgi:hypothetical protein
MEEVEEEKQDNGFSKWREEVFGLSSEEELREASETRNMFDVDSIVKHSEKLYKLHLPTLGAYIPYKPLRIIDEEAIENISHSNKAVELNLKNRMKVWKLVERTGDKRLTKEVIDTLPAKVIDVILMEYTGQEEERFLLPVLKRRRIGLDQILEHNR